MLYNSIGRTDFTRISVANINHPDYDPFASNLQSAVDEPDSKFIRVNRHFKVTANRPFLPNFPWHEQILSQKIFAGCYVVGSITLIILLALKPSLPLQDCFGLIFLFSTACAVVLSRRCHRGKDPQASLKRVVKKLVKKTPFICWIDQQQTAFVATVWSGALSRHQNLNKGLTAFCQTWQSTTVNKYKILWLRFAPPSDQEQGCENVQQLAVPPRHRASSTVVRSAAIVDFRHDVAFGSFDSAAPRQEVASTTSTVCAAHIHAQPADVGASGACNGSDRLDITAHHCEFLTMDSGHVAS